MTPRDEPTSERLHHQYDPWVDIEQRHPDWRVEIIDCEYGVEFYWDAKLVLIKTDVFLEDPEYATAYVAVHLDEHEQEMRDGWTPEQERWTEAQEDHANGGAALRLDRA